MFKNLLLSVIAIIAGLALSELTLISFGIPKFYDSDIRYEWYYHLSRDSSSILFYTMYPSLNLRFVYDGNPRKYFDRNNAVVHKINSMGFRGEELAEKKDTNTFRIAFMGDSFTFGAGVKDEDTYAEKVKNKLKKKFNNLNFESYNFGVIGYNTKDELYVLKNIVLKYKPNAVVLQYHLNDAEPEIMHYDKQTKSLQYNFPRDFKIHEALPDLGPPEKFIYKFRTAKLIWQVFKRKQITSKTINYYLNLYNENNPDYVTTKNSLKEFIEVCRENKIDCYIVLFPLLFRLNDDYPYNGIHSKIKNIVQSDSNGDVTFIDLFPAFKGKKDVDLWVHPSDQHPNEMAHEIAAQYLVQYIKVVK